MPTFKDDINNHSIHNGVLLFQGEECVVTAVLEQHHLLKKIAIGVFRKLHRGGEEGREGGRGGGRREGEEGGRGGGRRREGEEGREGEEKGKGGDSNKKVRPADSTWQL